MKIKVTKTETIEQEVDITFPCYYKKGSTNFIKILNETIGLHVWTPDICEDHAAISYTPNIADFITDGTPITEDEFDAAWVRTVKQIDNDYNK